MYGVSPAYFISTFGPGFGPGEMETALPGLRDLGYEAFQPEAFTASVGEAWTERDSERLGARASEIGLALGPFVAHWLGAQFASQEALVRPCPPRTAARVFEIAAELGCPAVALPLPALAGGEAETGREPLRGSLRRALRAKLGLFAEQADRAGLRLALELLPGNALGGSSAFLDLRAEPGFGKLGLLLDTGHLHVMGEAVAELPFQLGDAVAATHLCDNDGVENLSLSPGDGTLAFGPLLAALRASGYSGGLDVEIVCPAADVAREYRKALAALRAFDAAA